MTFRERIRAEAQAAVARKKAAEEKNKPETKPEEPEKNGRQSNAPKALLAVASSE